MITKDDFKVIEINKNSDNLIFIDRRAITMEIAQDMVNNYTGSNFRAIVLVNGNPNEAVKLISVDDLKK